MRRSGRFQGNATMSSVLNSSRAMTSRGAVSARILTSASASFQASFLAGVTRGGQSFMYADVHVLWYSPQPKDQIRGLSFTLPEIIPDNAGRLGPLASGLSEIE